jgi:hypothetical protein
VRYSLEYELMEVARWKGYADEEELFQKPPDVQARAIAHYRIYHQIQAVLAHEQATEAKRQRNATRNTGRRRKR